MNIAARELGNEVSLEKGVSAGWCSLFPDPLEDPKNGTSQNDSNYYIGEPKGLLKGSIFWIL